MTKPAPLLEARESSVAELPRMRVTLPLHIQGEFGLNMGEDWWVDARELVLWWPEKVPAGRDMLTRIDYHRGNTTGVTLRLLDGEVPARFRNGCVQIGRWIPRTADLARHADPMLRALNPEAFERDHRAPRLPNAAAAVEKAEKERPRGPSDIEPLRQKSGEEINRLQVDVRRLRGPARRSRDRGIPRSARPRLGASARVGVGQWLARGHRTRRGGASRGAPRQYRPARHLTRGGRPRRPRACASSSGCRDLRGACG